LNKSGANPEHELYNLFCYRALSLPERVATADFCINQLFRRQNADNQSIKKKIKKINREEEQITGF